MQNDFSQQEKENVCVTALTEDGQVHREVVDEGNSAYKFMRHLLIFIYFSP